MAMAPLIDENREWYCRNLGSNFEFEGLVEHCLQVWPLMFAPSSDS